MGSLPQFSASDYLLALPILLLTLFAIGILLIDLMIPPESKWANAVTALIGVLFATAGVVKIQLWMGTYRGVSQGAVGMMGTMLVDRVAIFFFYLFLAATGISILMSVQIGRAHV